MRDFSASFRISSMSPPENSSFASYSNSLRSSASIILLSKYFLTAISLVSYLNCLTLFLKIRGTRHNYVSASLNIFSWSLVPTNSSQFPEDLSFLMVQLNF